MTLEPSILKTPGPDHPLTISREPLLVRALFQGHLLALSEDVLVLREAAYPPVRYFPRADVEMAFLRLNPTKQSYCPYKGEASYFSLYRDGELVEAVGWTYDRPHPAAAPIAGRIAFYPQYVQFQTAPLAHDQAGFPVGAVVRHTDSGSGQSQEERWETAPDAPDAPPFRGVGMI